MQGPADLPTPILVESALPTPLLVEKPPPRGHPLAAWLVIVLLVSAIVGAPYVLPLSRGAAPREKALLLVKKLQARYLVGAKSLMPGPDPRLYKQAQLLNGGPVAHRLRFIVLAGEMAGPEEACTQLDRLSSLLATGQIEPTPEEDGLRDILGRLYADYANQQFAAPSVRDEERDLLREKLDWFGELALAPEEGPDPTARDRALAAARRTVIGVVGAFMVAGLVGVAGFVGLFLLVVLLFRGRLCRPLETRSPHGGIYAETFAVWMLLFLVLNVGATLLPIRSESLLLSGAAFLLSLSALAWPVCRGVPWRQVRQAIGLTGGRHPLLEVALGFGTYAMALPLLAVGLLLTLGLMALRQALQGGTGDGFGPSDMPAHPIIDFIARPGWWGRLQVVVLASIVAPLVEETMFRGVLYRHLREASARWGFAASLPATRPWPLPSPWPESGAAVSWQPWWRTGSTMGCSCSWSFSWRGAERLATGTVSGRFTRGGSGPPTWRGTSCHCATA